MPLTVPSSQGLKAIYDVPAPAKLNLFLHITGRRADGYHLMQSVFMLIDWCDVLHFELRTDGKISRSDAVSGSAKGACGSVANVLPAEDLSVRAARALQQASGTSLGVHITLEKRIPAQAGMGGGSSDAATSLLALQRLWKTALRPGQLHDIALGLGADVPFFLGGGHAWVEGIGERLTPIELPSARFLVVKPPTGLSTPEIFASPYLKRDSGTATILGFAADSQNGAYSFGKNDLQPVAQDLNPQIGQSLSWLSSLGLDGRMTGSGSAVFAHLPSGKWLEASDTSPGAGWSVRQCSNLDQHPLLGW
jgi:4-diphosphocytidyl-2-C-methyl-D-erythritol kinase